MEREKGAAVAACGGCGSEQSLVIQADGSVATSACNTCYPATKPKPAVPERASLFGGRVHGSETVVVDKEDEVQ